MFLDYYAKTLITITACLFICWINWGSANIIFCNKVYTESTKNAAINQRRYDFKYLTHHYIFSFCHQKDYNDRILRAYQWSIRFYNIHLYKFSVFIRWWRVLCSIEKKSIGIILAEMSNIVNSKLVGRHLWTKQYYVDVLLSHVNRYISARPKES